MLCEEVVCEKESAERLRRMQAKEFCAVQTGEKSALPGEEGEERRQKKLRKRVCVTASAFEQHESRHCLRVCRRDEIS